MKTEQSTGSQKLDDSLERPEQVRISVAKLAYMAHDAYSRPREMIPLMVLEIIGLWSTRGITTFDNVEIVARKYASIYPKSNTPLNIFLDQVRREFHVT